MLRGCDWSRWTPRCRGAGDTLHGSDARTEGSSVSHCVIWLYLSGGQGMDEVKADGYMGLD